MKNFRFLSLFAMYFTLGSASGQKPNLAIDSSTSWTSVSSPLISDDGEFICYVLEGKHSTLVITSVDGNYHEEISRGSDAVFSASNTLLFRNSGDSLCTYDLKKKIRTYISNVKEFQLNGEADNQWIIYKNKNEIRNIILLNLVRGEKVEYNNVDALKVNNQGTALLLYKNGRVYWIDLLSKASKEIFRGSNVSNIIFDEKGSQAVFSSATRDGVLIFHYKKNAKSAQLLIDNDAVKLGKNLVVSNSIASFDYSGENIFFEAENRVISKAKEEQETTIVRILKSPTTSTGEIPKKTVFAYSFRRKNLVEVCSESQSIISNFTNTNQRYIIVRGEERGVDDKIGSSIVTRYTLQLFDLVTGKKYLIAPKILLSNSVQLSPGGRYVLYYDKERKRYFSFDNKTKRLLDPIGGHLILSSRDSLDNNNVQPEYGIGGWAKDDSFVLLYDEFDVWKIDPSGIKPPVNLTCGFGKKNNIILRLIDFNGQQQVVYQKTMVLSAFNKLNKQSGFYKAYLDVPRSPDSLTMGSYVYHLNRSSLVSSYFLGNNGIDPIKAKNKKGYVFFRMNSSESPNLFYTSDFMTFKPISKNYPEKKYNWIKSELIKYESNGKQMEGILYKPENFSTDKKYPVIVYFYEHHSDFLNQFIVPEISDGKLPIPYFVSNDYLVFVPNIYYKSAQIGLSVSNSVLAGIASLSSLGFVDKSRIGIQGFSLGGYEVNYLITQTTILKAAISTSGASNLISNYSTADAGIIMSEKGSYRLDHSIWENREAYIRNSPIFYANQVETPILIVAGEKDLRVPKEQGLEFFTALRRLNKQAWFLEYKGQEHGLYGLAALDYQNKIKEFFDHYLKNMSMPDWMNGNSQ